MKSERTRFKSGSKRALALAMLKRKWTCDVDLAVSLDTPCPARIRQIIQQRVPLQVKKIEGVKHYRVAA